MLIPKLTYREKRSPPILPQNNFPRTLGESTQFGDKCRVMQTQDP